MEQDQTNPMPPEVMQMIQALAAQQQAPGLGTSPDLGGQAASLGNGSMPETLPSSPLLDQSQGVQGVNQGMPQQPAQMQQILKSLQGPSPITSPDLTQAAGAFGGTNVNQGAPFTAGQ